MRRFLARLRRVPVMGILELVGFGCLIAAAYAWQPIAGLVALGIALIVIANGVTETRP